MIALMQWGQPMTRTKVRIFLGLDGYYCRFIQGFLRITGPLTNLTRKWMSFCWDASCQQEFEELKERLTTAPVLSFPRGGIDYMVFMNSSLWGLDGILMQEERHIANASRKLEIHERNYSIQDYDLARLFLPFASGGII